MRMLSLRKIITKLIHAEPWPASAMSLPKLQIHRGDHRGGHQENTIPAFESAYTRGAEICECDLRLSKDRVVVVIHERDLKRVKGLPDLVAET